MPPLSRGATLGKFLISLLSRLGVMKVLSHQVAEKLNETVEAVSIAPCTRSGLGEERW